MSSGPASARRRTNARVRREEARERILAAAEILLLERPYREITVEQVMAGAGLSRTVFYRHFDGLPDVLLTLLRDSGVPHKVVTTGGQYQQSLPPGRIYNLMRVRLETDEFVPEISGHRLMVMVRLMRQEPDGRLRPATSDTSFELALCS